MSPDWLKSMLSDGATPPSVSMSRVLALATVILVVGLPAVLWFWLSCLHGKMEDFPGSYTAFSASASAITLAMFAANKRAE